MIPTVGRIVHYRLSEADVLAINHQRQAQGTSGNPVTAGDVFPAVIVRNWFATDTPPTNEQQACQLQVFLDGPLPLWVTSRQQGSDPANDKLPGMGQWIEPPRF